MLLAVFILLLGPSYAEDDPLSEYIHVPTRYIAPIPANSILKDDTSPEKMSVNLCAAKCTLLFRSGKFPCYAFEYTPGSNMCIYTNITTLMLNAGYLSLKQNDAVHYYERPKGSFKNLFHELPHTALKDQSSYYEMKGNVTLDQCAQMCLISSGSGCMSFSFSPNMRVCGLSDKYHSNSARPTTSLIATPLYNHFQYFTSWPCNAIIPKNYNPKAIASVRFPYQAVRNVQCYIKLEAPPGHRIQISFSTIYFGGNVCYNSGEGIKVHDGDSIMSPMIGRFCQQTRIAHNIRRSSSNSLFLTYKTGSVPLAFKAVYQFENPCDDHKCKNGAICMITNSSYICQCPSGWSGRFCDANIDDCMGEPCLFGGTCIDKLNNYSCQCLKEFSGNRCEIFLGKCADNPCVHGKCHVRSRHNYTCSCEEGFIGKNCDHKVNFCDPNPCLHGYCYETFGHYICRCYSGYTGSNCETYQDMCYSRPCVKGFCSSFNGTYHCACPAGFTGRDCGTMIDYCEGVHCNHGKCLNLNNTYRCECKEGWTGNACDVDIVLDPCEKAHCGRGQCKALHSSRMPYRCVCPTGYNGPHCEERVISHKGKGDGSAEECMNVNCLNGGMCRVIDGVGVCSCIAPYVGTFCDTRLSDCQFNPCHMNSTCVDTRSGHVCVCSEGMAGVACNRKVSACRTNPCIQGVCQETNSTDGYMCILYTMIGHSNITISPNYTITAPYNQATTVPPIQNATIPERNDVICDSDSMSVFVPADLLSQSDQLTWRDPHCKVLNNGTHFISTISHTACGATVLFTDDEVIFRNDLNIHSSSSNDSIDYGSTNDIIPVRCVYPRQQNITTSYRPVQSHVRFYEKRYGHLDVDLEQYQSEKFVTELPGGSFPREVELDKDIFIKLHAQHTNSTEVALKVERCVATPSAMPANGVVYQLIDHGCPASSAIKIYPSSFDEARFSVKAFEFKSNPGSIVYIHCQVSVCSPTSPQCVHGCASRQRRAVVEENEDAHLVSGGPYLVVADKGSLQMSTVVAAVCACLAVVATVFAVVGWRRKSK